MSMAFRASLSHSPARNVTSCPSRQDELDSWRSTCTNWSSSCASTISSRHHLSVLLLHNFLASYEEMFAKVAYVRKLKGHMWKPKANVNANMVDIHRLHLEGVVIVRETDLGAENREALQGDVGGGRVRLAAHTLARFHVGMERRARLGLRDVGTRRLLVDC